MASPDASPAPATRGWLERLGPPVDALVALAALVLVGLEIARAPRWTVDDAWIVVRYAENWVHHGELAFNLGERPVEGFTSPLMLAVAALAVAIGANAMNAMILAAKLAVPVGALALFRIARAIDAPPPAGGLVVFAFLSAPSHLEHATSGLETEVFLASTLLVAWALVRSLREPDRLLAVSLSGLLCALVRPEGTVVAVVAILLASAHARRRGASLRTLALVAGAPFAVPLALAILARWAHFGALVPNTFYAKSGDANAVFALDLLALARATSLPLAATAAAAWGLERGIVPSSARSMGSARAARSGLAALALTGVVALAFAYSRSDLLMNYGTRFAMHALPFVALLLLGLLARGLESLAAIACTAPFVASTLAGCATLALLGTWPRQADARRSSIERASSYDVTMNDRYVPIARQLRDELPRDALLAVYPDAGIVPYVSRLRTVDFGRLNDAPLARGSRDPEAIRAYFFARRPDALLVSIGATGEAWDRGAQAILDDAAFRETFRLVRDEGKPGRPHIRLYLRGAR